jgi:hypothetical protein
MILADGGTKQGESLSQVGPRVRSIQPAEEHFSQFIATVALRGYRQVDEESCYFAAVYFHGNLVEADLWRSEKV